MSPDDRRERDDGREAVARVIEPERREARRLQARDSPAARTPAAEHDDVLSPTQALHESINLDGSQRVGSSPPVANPIVTFPERLERDARGER